MIFSTEQDGNFITCSKAIRVCLISCTVKTLAPSFLKLTGRTSPLLVVRYGLRGERLHSILFLPFKSTCCRKWTPSWTLRCYKGNWDLYLGVKRCLYLLSSQVTTVWLLPSHVYQHIYCVFHLTNTYCISTHVLEEIKMTFHIFFVKRREVNTTLHWRTR